MRRYTRPMNRNTTVAGGTPTAALAPASPLASAATSQPASAALRSIALAATLVGISLPAWSDIRSGELLGGVLDRPVLFESPAGGAPAAGGIGNSPSGPPVVPIEQGELQRAVHAEQDALERLERPALERRAEAGERVAQVVLGADFAKEAASLAFAPIAANAAIGDALSWYARAASRGFPGAPSLDQAGVRFYPIRAQREFRP